MLGLLGCAGPQQVCGTSSLCTSQLILLRIIQRRKERSDGRSTLFPLTPSTPFFFFFFLQFTHTEKKVSTKSVIHLQMCSSLSMFPVEERERETESEGEGGAEMERHREQAAVCFSVRLGLR